MKRNQIPKANTVHINTSKCLEMKQQDPIGNKQQHQKSGNPRAILSCTTGLPRDM